MSQLVRKLSASSPSKHELRKLLQGMLNHERVAEVHVLLAMLCDAGLPVDVVMFNLLMTGYKKRRQWQAAQRNPNPNPNPNPTQVGHSLGSAYASYAAQYDAQRSESEGLAGQG